MNMHEYGTYYRITWGPIEDSDTILYVPKCKIKSIADFKDMMPEYEDVWYLNIEEFKHGKKIRDVFIYNKYSCGATGRWLVSEYETN